MKSYKAVINGKDTIFTYIGTRSIPPFNKVTSVLAIPFTRDGQIIAVRLKHRGVDIPGGHVEPGEETPEQTLSREII